MDVRELLTDLRVDFLESGHHHCRPGWVQLKHCPFCDSSNYHLGVNTTGMFAACWKCGGHSLWSVLEKIGVARRDIKDTLRGLDRLPAVAVPKRGKLKEPKGLGPLLEPHRRYLEQRGFDPDELVSVWGLRGIGLAVKLAWRIYIPVTHRGEQVSWTTRSIGTDNSLRYQSASPDQEAYSIKHLIYGLDYCRHSVVVVEGPTDAWAVGPGAGAVFGTAFTTPQVRLLAQVPNRFVCFDSEPTAQRAALELVHQLSCFPGNTCNVQLDAKDPGSAARSELCKLRKAARLD